jgi:hypothetical protein
MVKWIKFEEVINLMKQGWELGYTINLGRNPRYWLQKKLCCRGDTFKVNGNTIKLLKNKNLIELEPKHKGDSFWLTRYKLK